MHLIILLTYLIGIPIAYIVIAFMNDRECFRLTSARFAMLSWLMVLGYLISVISKFMEAMINNKNPTLKNFWRE